MSWDYKMYSHNLLTKASVVKAFESALKLTGGSECKEESNLHWES